MDSQSETQAFRPLTPWNPLDQLRLLWWLFVHPARFIAYRSQVGEEKARKAVIWLVSTLFWLPQFVSAFGNGFGLIDANRNHISYDGPPSGISYLGWAGIIPLAWMLTSLLGTNKNRWARFAALGVAGVAGYTYGSRAATSLGAAGPEVLGVTLFLTIGLITTSSAWRKAAGFLAINWEASGVAAGILLGVSLASGVESDIGIFHDLALFALGPITVKMVDDVLEKSLQSGRASLASRLIPVALVVAYAALVWIYLLGG